METKEEVNARKERIQAKEAMALLAAVNEVYAAKGKHVVHVDLKKDRPTDEELKGLVLGPTGNLRAPTLRKGKTLIVGFNECIYQKLIC